MLPMLRNVYSFAIIYFLNHIIYFLNHRFDVELFESHNGAIEIENLMGSSQVCANNAILE